MRRSIIVMFVVLTLLFMTIPQPSTDAIAPQYSPPVIRNLYCSHNYSKYPSTIMVECQVTWDPAAIAKFVWLYVDGTRYVVPCVYEGGQWKYKISVSVDPWVTHSVYVKAREVIDWDIISYDTTTATQYVYRLYTDNYSPAGSKYAIVLDLTPRSDRNSSCLKVGTAYWAHYNSWLSMGQKVRSSGYDSSRIWNANIDQAVDSEDAGACLIDELKHFSTRTTQNDFVFIYIVAHGSPTGVQWDGRQAATWSEIDSALDTYSYSRMVVAIEACYSGDDISILSGTNRLIITACSGNEGAYHIENDDVTLTKSLFTYNFLLKLTPSSSFAYAYYHASVACSGTQSPQMSVAMTEPLARIRLSY